MKTHVKELVAGDEVWVENHYGEFELHPVVAVEAYRIVIPRQRFSKKTGWEKVYTLSRRDLTSGNRHPHRIHNGDGLLYTTEYIRGLKRKSETLHQQTELIYKLMRLSPVLWRKLTVQQLIQIEQWLEEA